MSEGIYSFRPEDYVQELSAIVAACSQTDSFDDAVFQGILRRYPKDGRGFFSKSEILRGYRFLRNLEGPVADEQRLFERLRMKPIRTRSGVAPVTVLSQPFPCPGQCIFCPSDVRMPKSYVSSEPGAQRAAEHRFDPYLQTASRLTSLHNIGHPVEKVELIILGGTWSNYPEGYRLWFVTRCLQALNAFDPAGGAPNTDFSEASRSLYPFEQIEDVVEGGRLERRYNKVVMDVLDQVPAIGTWEQLADEQRRNERAGCRCVGLVMETRPDHLDILEVTSLRRMGATKVQIGYQSLDDEVLRLNRRGHDVACTRRAMKLLRGAGFKIHAHWMPNLYGSSLERDREDYLRMFADPELRPDELKIYPCSLLETAELMSYYERGEWLPYAEDDLETLLADCMAATPEWCRLTRVIRDIPSTEIVDGNRTTNLRERAEASARRRGLRMADIRSREVRGGTVRRDRLRLEEVAYETGVGEEHFLQFVDGQSRLAGFLRLSLPTAAAPLAELRGRAVIREVHVYGAMVGLGERRAGAAQHRGLGRELVETALAQASRRGYRGVAVISSIGTRDYYRRLGFVDGDLYQHRRGARGHAVAG